MMRNRFVAGVITCSLAVAGAQLLIQPVRAADLTLCPPDELCPPPTLSADADVISAGNSVLLRGNARPGTAVALLSYSRPSTTYTAIRSGIADGAGDFTFSVAPMTSSRMYVSSLHGDSLSVAVLVRRVVSLAVISAPGCILTAVGSVSPSEPPVTVDIGYRAATGRIVRAMSTTTRSDGTYAVGRSFGACDVTLAWRASTPSTFVNASGVSPLRTGRLVP